MAELFGRQPYFGQVARVAGDETGIAPGWTFVQPDLLYFCIVRDSCLAVHPVVQPSGQKIHIFI